MFSGFKLIKYIALNASINSEIPWNMLGESWFLLINRIFLSDANSGISSSLPSTITLKFSYFQALK